MKEDYYNKIEDLKYKLLVLFWNSKLFKAVQSTGKLLLKLRAITVLFFAPKYYINKWFKKSNE